MNEERLTRIKLRHARERGKRYRQAWLELVGSDVQRDVSGVEAVKVKNMNKTVGRSCENGQLQS